MIVGREKEIKKLQELHDSDSAELVALYGRRRVGKTFLIDNVFENNIFFRHAGLSPVEGNTMREQLLHFHRSLKLSGWGKNDVPTSWLEAFYMLEDLIEQHTDRNKKVVIFIDEIQWMDTPKAKFMTGFEAFWNGWACHKNNVMVVVCGSSSSWILDKLINNHGGLYNRVTCEIKLQPFTLRECEKYFESRGVTMSRYDIVQAYMMLGGIPFYLKYLDKSFSLAQNIDSLFFAENALLKDEFDRLFITLFTNSEEMKTIVRALSEKNRGLSRKEIVQATGIEDSGDFSKKLKALVSGGFVIKYSSFGNGKREDFYKLIDPFCLFYLKFMRDKKRKNWINIEETRKVVVWKGYAFENVCWNHISQIKDALKIGGVVTEESLWSKRGDETSDGTQIDLIIDRKDHVVNMCEIKFYSDEFAVDKEYHLVLERRKKLLREIISAKSVVHSTLITTYGLRRNEYNGDFVSVIKMDDLFA